MHKRNELRGGGELFQNKGKQNTPARNLKIFNKFNIAT